MSMVQSISGVAFGPQQLDQPALLVVDMQNDFVRLGAPLEVPDARETIPFQQALIDVFRSLKRPVLFTRFVSQESENLLWKWSPQCRPDTRCCWRGHIRNFPEFAWNCPDISGIFSGKEPPVQSPTTTTIINIDYY